MRDNETYAPWLTVEFLDKLMATLEKFFYLAFVLTYWAFLIVAVCAAVAFIGYGVFRLVGFLRSFNRDTKEHIKQIEKHISLWDLSSEDERKDILSRDDPII